VVATARLKVLLAAVALVAVAAGAAAAAPTWVVDGTCRDGAAHGAYQLRTSDGQLRVAGAFSKGKWTGSFLFWNAAGVRVAHLPFDDDARSGTLVLWQAPAGRKGEPVQSLEAVYAHGVLAGAKRSWYPDGRPRGDFRYDHGNLVEAAAFDAAGRRLSATQARTMAERDLAADEKTIAAFEAMVRDHLPGCATQGRET
jgi:hypothetical protein